MNKKYANLHTLNVDTHDFDAQELISMEKAEFQEKIRENLKSILTQHHTSQSEIQKECLKNGYQISQPEISKILSGKAPVTIYQLEAFSSVLKISLDELVNGEKEKRNVMLDGGSMFLTDPSNKAFNGYLGEFQVLLHSTVPYDDTWHQGRLKLEAVGNQECKAIFELNTGVKDTRGADVVKSYSGQFIISAGLGVAYCVLLNEKIGEVVVMELRHRNFFIKQVACRLGLLLSTSAGEQKLPIVQKILLSRTPFMDEKLNLVKPYLKMTDEDVVISRSELQFLKRKYADLHIDVTAVDDSEPCYILDERMIRGSNRSLNRFELARIISALRTHSHAPWWVNITEREDSLIYDIENSFVE